jgi:fatty-acyl-CoA synthase
VVREGHVIDARELKEHLKPFVSRAHEQVGDPEPDRLVTEIPKTSVGKLDKKRIRLDITEWQANNSTFLSTL